MCRKPHTRVIPSFRITGRLSQGPWGLFSVQVPRRPCLLSIMALTLKTDPVWDWGKLTTEMCREAPPLPRPPSHTRQVNSKALDGGGGDPAQELRPSAHWVILGVLPKQGANWLRIRGLETSLPMSNPGSTTGQHHGPET